MHWTAGLHWVQARNWLQAVTASGLDPGVTQ